MPFTLHPLTTPDIPTCISIYFTSFSTQSHSLACWPRNNPTVHTWWTQMFHDELHEKGAHWLKAVDKKTGEIAAYCKWVQVEEGKEIDVGLPEWPEGADARLCEETFGAWARKRGEIVGRRGHWYLEMLATHPKFQGKGAGSMLLQWGLQKADEKGVEAYLESSPEGLSLYRRFGFREVDHLDTWIENEWVNGEWYREVFMLRAAKGEEVAG